MTEASKNTSESTHPAVVAPIDDRGDPTPVRASLTRRDRRAVLASGLSMLVGLVATGRTTSAASVAAVAGPATEPADLAVSTVPLPPTPTVDGRFPHEIAPGVFILPDKRIPLVPNVGIIVGRDAVLVVDAGIGTESGQNVMDATRRLAGGRKIILTVTRAHPEHIFGTHVFGSDVRFVTNRRLRDYYERSGSTLLAGFRGTLSPGDRPVLDGVKIVPPNDTFDGETATVDLGGRTVELRAWGTAHSPGDQTVFLPDEQVLFTGDLIEERMFPIVPLFPPMIDAADINVGRWQAALAGFAGSKPRLLVPGHGNLGGLEIATAVGDYFSAVRAQAVRLADRDVTAEQIAQQLEPLVRAQYPTWERAQYIAPALRYFGQRLA